MTKFEFKLIRTITLEKEYSIAFTDINKECALNKAKAFAGLLNPDGKVIGEPADEWFCDGEAIPNEAKIKWQERVRQEMFDNAAKGPVHAAAPHVLSANESYIRIDAMLDGMPKLKAVPQEAGQDVNPAEITSTLQIIWFYNRDNYQIRKFLHAGGSYYKALTKLQHLMGKNTIDVATNSIHSDTLYYVGSYEIQEIK